MSGNLSKEYPHPQFRKQWELTHDDLFMLGQCDVFIKAIIDTPIDPVYYQELMQVALRKGAQATTAIEGNTLSEEEIVKIEKGERLPPSKGYQETEVKNILNAFNRLLQETIIDNKDLLITPELLKSFHYMIGQNLGDHFAAQPGAFRTGSNNVVIGTYRAAEGVDVELLIDRLCGFLRDEFRYEKGGKSYMATVIEAIVAHVYIEWIHPFGDGNGRTGRLVEFYILLRGGLPDIALHILSNHYNMTRNEYYRQLQMSSEKRSLTEFIRYAIQGLRDGLDEILLKIQKSQFESAWREYIYKVFSEQDYSHKEVLKRRRTLALEFPLNLHLSAKQIPGFSIPLARIYSGVSEKTLSRDIDELMRIGILTLQDDKYISDVSRLTPMIAKSKYNRLFYNLHYVK